MEFVLGKLSHFYIQLPIQTPHSVAPQLQVFVSSLEKCQNFSKTSTPQTCLQSSAENGNLYVIQILFYLPELVTLKYSVVLIGLISCPTELIITPESNA